MESLGTYRREIKVEREQQAKLITNALRQYVKEDLEKNSG